MSDDHFEITEGREVVRHTIVGGRPMARRKKTLKIPIGIEKVLARAAGDADFRKALLADRRGALEAAGYLMIDSELELLTGIPDALLSGMIRRIDLKEHGKRKFLRGVTAAVFSAAALTTAVDCGGSAGSTRDYGPTFEEELMPVQGETADEVEAWDVSKGNEPDEPRADVVETEQYQGDGGINPYDVE